MGVVFSENHNAGISERDRRITYMDALVKQAAKWGGYVINCDMNDAPKDTGGSDHGGTLEYFLNNETLYQTAEKVFSKLHPACQNDQCVEQRFLQLA